MNLDELLARTSDLSALSDEDLSTLEADLLAAFDSIRSGEIDGVDERDVERLQAVADAADAVRGEAARRLSEAAERDAQIAEIEGRLRPVAETPTEPKPDDDDDDDKGDEAPPSAEAPPVEPVVVEAPAPAPAPEPELVPAAAAPAPAPVADLAAHTAPAPAGFDSPARAIPRLLAVPANVDIRDREQLAREFSERLRAFERTDAHFTERVPVARIRLDYPEERDLRGVDLATADARMEAVTAGADRPEAWAGLVASGGFCAPLDVDYGLVNIAEDFRPVRDSLARFAANRGGLRFTFSPGLSTITVAGDASNPAAAVSVWSAATDETPSESTKGIQTIACGDIRDVELQAIVRRLQFGNFSQMAYPEWVAHNVDLTRAAHARQAETELLDAMAAAAGVLNVTTAAVTGASRDLLVFIDQAAAGFRSRHRMRPDAMMHVTLPAWVVNMMRADLAFQQPGDGNGGPVFDVTEASVRAWFSARNVNVTFHVDTPTGAGQVFAVQGEPSDLRNFPATVVWYLYPEGGYTFLDGGELDLGIVRDSTLNDTNDFQLFAETFENVAFRGPEALVVTSTVCANGESQVATDETGSVCTAS